MLTPHNFYQLGGPVQRRWSKMPTWCYLLIVLLLAQGCLVGTFWIGAIAQSILLNVSVLSLVSLGEINAGSLTAMLVANFLPLFFCVALALWVTESRGLQSVGMQSQRAFFYYGRGLLVGVVLFGMTVLCMSLLGYVAVENPFRLRSIAGACLILVGWIVQGAAEEVLTRGFLLQIFGRVTTSAMGVFVSTAFFTVMHVNNRSFSIIAMFNLLLFSVFAALYTLYERGLWGVFAIHSMWNWAQGNLFGFQVSGYEVEVAVIIDLKEAGPDILTGGTYGPEGGLIVSLVLIAALLWIGYAHRRRMLRCKQAAIV